MVTNLTKYHIISHYKLMRFSIMEWEYFRLSKRLSLPGEVTETLYRKIAYIDAIKNTFTLTGQLLPQTVNRLTHSVIVTSTGA